MARENEHRFNIKTELEQVARDIANGITMNRSDARVCRDALARIEALESEVANLRHQLQGERS